ncbi:peptidoglycan-binding protein [Nonomuraea sp. NPDC059007]|uniref:peptidoglycan-binding protein n=1 Tax=Nonomuraea sp. NPDC059007 TaxID=3346692 RepID=UPI0036AA57CF
MNEALRYEGYRETAGNKTQFGKEYGWNGVAWCAIFLAVVTKRAYARTGSPEPKADAAELVPWTASCLNAVAWFKARGRWSQTPQVGSFIFYGPGGGTHVELVTKVTANSIETVGGNTGGSYAGRYFDGNGVYTKTISRKNSRIYGYGYPKYKAAASTSPTDRPGAGEVPNFPGKYFRLGATSRFLVKWQRRMVQRGWQLAIDGVFGPETLKVVKAFQAQKGLTVDGVIGPKTWTAAWTEPIS